MMMARVWLALSCVGTFASTGLAQTAAPSAFDERTIDSIVTAQIAERGLAGISLGVMREGRIVLVKGYGLADRERGIPVDTLTRFPIGSVTKQFTSAIILQLDAEGRLSVHDKVAKWYPELTRAADITLLDLMNHTSGYPDYYPLDFVDRPMLAPIDADAIIRQFATKPLDFEPGTRWSYSNTGFTILGRIAERVTGRSLDGLLQERIFRAFDMPHTTYQPDARGREYARRYARFALGPLMPAVSEGNGWTGAAGGIYSTPADLLRWDLALMSGRVVQGEQLRLMTTARRLADGSSTGYGSGLGIGRLGADTTWQHGGGVSGAISNNLLIPWSRSAVVVLSNAEGSLSMGALLPALVTVRPAPAADSARAPSPPSAERPAPDIAGPPAVEVATAMLRQLQSGTVDRSKLGAEYSWWLTPARLDIAREHLGPLGEPSATALAFTGERGGMEVTSTVFTFGSRKVRALMYRTPDGLIQEFLVN